MFIFKKNNDQPMGKEGIELLNLKKKRVDLPLIITNSC